MKGTKLLIKLPHFFANQDRLTCAMACCPEYVCYGVNLLQQKDKFVVSFLIYDAAVYKPRHIKL